MPRLLLLLPLSFALTACGGSFEAACKDFCDKSAECSSVAASDADLLKCKNDCELAELEGQQEIDAGTLTQRCYDATTDAFSCVSGLSCAEINSGSRHRSALRSARNSSWPAIEAPALPGA